MDAFRALFGICQKKLNNQGKDAWIGFHTKQGFRQQTHSQEIQKSFYRVPGPHGEEVCHHGAESGSKTGLCDEAKLELCQADHVVPLLPVPAGDVEQVGLVVVLHQLDYDLKSFTGLTSQIPFLFTLISSL